MKAYQAIASALCARNTCAMRLESGQDAEHWRAMIDMHESRIDSIVRQHFPSGSGFDRGTRFDADRSNADMLVFSTDFHHMNEHGSYDGWTAHIVRVRPSLVFGFTVSVSGLNRNGIKDYIAEVFGTALDAEV